MSRRGTVTWLMIVVGLVLMVGSYFFWSAPWCANGVECSNPSFQWAPAIFVVGVIVSFSSAIYYVVAKDS
jgi:hypothetical protein